MGIDLQITEEDFSAAENHSWLGSAHGTDSGDSITIRGANFVGTFTDGIVPSGVIVSKIGGAGTHKDKYTLRTSGTAETVALSRTSTGGTVLVAYAGQAGVVTVSASAAGFTAANLQLGLDSIPGIPDGYLVASGSAGGPLTVTGPEGVDLGALTVDNTSATGGTVSVGAPAQATVGTKAAGHLLQMQDVGAGNDVVCSIIWHGEVIVENLPANSGYDDSVPADLPTIRYQV